MNLLAELNRRNVIRMGVTYLVVSWLILQVADVVFPALHLPGWAITLVTALLGIGFVVALVFSWIFELTPEGLVRDTGQGSHDYATRKLDVATIVAVVALIGFMVWRGGRDAPAPAQVAHRGQAPAPTIEPTEPAEAVLALGVAVLPFDNLSPDPDNAFFASGVHEDVLTFLSRVADLRVISRTSVENYADSELSLPAIGRELGVSHVVEGSVRRAEDRVRVTVQLIDAATDAHLWSENYDRDLVDIFAIQTEVAKAIVAQVETELSPEAAEALSAPGTANVAAYDLLIRGRETLARAVSEGQDAPVLEAARLLEQAVRSDPSQVGAWVRLVEACGLVVWNFPDDEAADCRTWVDEALAELSTLAPASTEALVATAMYHYYLQQDPAAAAAILEPLVETAPNSLDVLQFLGLSARRIARWELAIDAMRRAVLLDPANPRRYTSLMNILRDRAAYGEAIKISETALGRFPDVWWVRFWHAQLMRDGQGDIAPYREFVHSATPLQRRNLGPSDRYGVFDSLEETLAWLEGTDLASDDPIVDVLFQFSVALAYWGWGDPAQGKVRAQRAQEAWRALGESRAAWTDHPTYLSIGAVLAALAGDHESASLLRDQGFAQLEDFPDIVVANNARVNLAYVLAMTEDPEASWREIEPLIGVPSGESQWEIYWSRFNRIVFADVPEFQALISRLDAELAARDLAVSFIAELKRRNVIRVAVAYLVLSWLVLQVGDVLVQGLDLPAVWSKAVIALLALGVIPVLVFSWIYEITPEGLKRESEIVPDQSITAHTAKKLDLAVIVLLVLAGGLYGYVNLVADRGQEPVAAAPTRFATTTDLSIAVLPFVNISADPENEYFADGLSEELLNRLAQVPKLRVAGRTSSFQFKGENRDLREIGAQLRVSYLLEGSVRRQGNQVRITAQLIQAKEDTHLWSETYDHTLDDVFAIQDEISEQVVDAMNIVLDETERQRMLNAGIRNVDAFVAYQRGLRIFNDAHGSVDDLVAGLAVGMPYFDTAVEAVPTFAAAWLARMDYFAHILFADGYTEAEYEQALVSLHDSLDRAIEFARDPDRRAVAQIDSVLFSEDWSDLRTRIERALEIDDCVTSVWGMEMASLIGYSDRTEHYWRKQVACDPLTAYYRTELAHTLRLQERQEEALAVFHKAATELGDGSWLADGISGVLIELGRVDEALEVARTISAETPFNAMFSVVAALAAAGRVEEAQALIAEWDRRPGDRSDMFMTMAALVGDRDAVNAMAAKLDARPAGTMLLLVQAYTCGCGALFDLEIAPNLAARLEEAVIAWPPPTRVEYPAKDW